MGQEIVYCARCQIRITGRDFESGIAFRAGNHFYCKSCFQQLTPEEKGKAEPHAPARSGPSSSARLKPITSRKTVPTERDSWIPLAVGGILAVSLLLLLLVFILLPGRKPAPPSPAVQPPRPELPSAPKPAAASESLEREKEEARREIERREEERRRKEEEAKSAAELAKLDDEVRSAGAEGKFDRALEILDRARARRTGPEWAAQIDRRAEAVKEEARRAAKPPEKEAVKTPVQPPKEEPAPPPPPREAPKGSLVVYRDALAKGWLNYSWNSVIDFKAAPPPPETGACISFVPKQAWAGLYLRAPGTIDAADYPILTLRLRATGAGQKYMLGLYRQDASGKKIKDAVPLEKLGGQPPAGEWKRYEIPVERLGAAGCRIEAVVIQDAKGGEQPPLLVDDVELLPRAADR